MLEDHGRGHPSPLPVVHALEPAFRAVDTKNSAERGIAAGLVDECRCFVWVHAPYGKRCVYGVSNTLLTMNLNSAFSIVGVAKKAPTHPGFLKALKRAEQVHGVGLTGFAEDLGISRQSLNNWRARGIPPREWPRVAAYLLWSVEELQGLSAPKKAPTEWPFPDIDPARFYRLTEGQQLQVQGVIIDKIAEFEAVARTPLQRLRRK